MIFKGSGCFQFPEAVVTFTAKGSLHSTVCGSLQVLASIGLESAEWKMPCTTVTSFCNEGKVMLLLSMVRSQVLLCFRHTRYRLYCYEHAM